MNNLKLIKLVYKIQDLVFKNKVPSFKIFKKVCKEFEVPQHQLERIYAFVDTVQHHPKSLTLFVALTPMFKMLLDYMVSHDYVNVYHGKLKKHFYINYDEIFIKFKMKRIIQTREKFYIIPYLKRATTQQCEEEEDDLPEDW